MSGPAGFVHNYTITCPPSQRTFNSDGTRVSEAGLKDWEHPERGVVELGSEDTSTRELESKRLNWRKEKAKAASSGDEVSIKSGLSGDTLRDPLPGEGERRKSLLKKLFNSGEKSGDEGKSQH